MQGPSPSGSASENMDAVLVLVVGMKNMNPEQMLWVDWICDDMTRSEDY